MTRIWQIYTDFDRWKELTQIWDDKVSSQQQIPDYELNQLAADDTLLQVADLQNAISLQH